MVDIGSSLLFILCFPLIFFPVRNPGKFLANCFSVFFGKKTWVGYTPDAPQKYLPPIRTGIIQPYNILNGYHPSYEVTAHVNTTYAEHYSPITDINLILRNFKFLGGE